MNNSDQRVLAPRLSSVGRPQPAASSLLPSNIRQAMAPRPPTSAVLATSSTSSS